MKKIVSLLAVILVSFSLKAQFQSTIQIAILFDTSNSMDGLIDQAKSRIWSIINTTTTLRYQGQVPKIEIALYDYGNDNISKESNYVRRILPFTNDLDLLSQKLFALTTRGGAEYCGAVISSSLSELSWSLGPNDLKLIYIAGNEPFNQGNVFYKDVCANAVKQNIQVNTIYCGDYQQGITDLWYDGANLGGGEYSNINSNLQVKHYDTPYDQQIRLYNDSLNRTYYGYGEQGKRKKDAQVSEDANAAQQSAGAMAERSVVKSKSVYKNDSWDLIDAFAKDSTILKKTENRDLPKELIGKSNEEIKNFIDTKQNERIEYQKKIQEISAEREKFITKLKSEEKTEGESDFGEEIQKNVLNSANKKGFELEKK